MKRFCGVLAGDAGVADRAIDVLASAWGAVDLRGGPVPFTFTDYYTAEMGPGLLRIFVSFQPAVCAEDAAGWKAFTNDVERRFAVNGRRRVNLDPGFLDLARVVLLSTKDAPHRIHLASGIFAEVTLVYRRREFAFLPWTYPDYRCAESLSFFRTARDRFKEQAAVRPAASRSTLVRESGHSGRG